MKHKFFAIPVLDSDQAEAELNRNQNIGFRLSLAQHRIGITVKDQRLILFYTFGISKKQGRPYVSNVYESVWDDRLQGAPCSSH